MMLTWRRVAYLTWMFAALAVFWAAPVFAAEAAAAVPKLNLWQIAIPIVVPLVIAGLKWGLDWLPGWTLPILAPLLGGVADAVLAWVAGGVSNPLLGAALGSAGVGIREVVDQVKQK